MLIRFVVKTRDLVEWECIPLQVSSCSDISETKADSTTQNGVAVTRPCVRCKVTGEEIGSGGMAGEGLVRELERKESFSGNCNAKYKEHQG